MTNKKEKRYLFILALTSIFAFFSNLWVRPADLMEARNFITAREMLESGNFIIPTLNGYLRFEKPPLPTWITAGVMKITGNFTTEWILRIPVALLSVLLIFLIYDFVKVLTSNKRLGFITSFVGATTFMLIKVGNENTWDMYTYVFALGSILFLLKGLKKGKMINFWLCGVFLSASIMSKGPVGIYGLFLPFIISYSAIYGVGEFRKNFIKIIFAILVGVALSGIWPYLMYEKYPDIFLDVLKKEEKTWNSRHTESFFYYLDYFVYMGVWIFFSAVSYFKTWKIKDENKKYSKFILLWNIGVIVFISLIKMKKKRYGIPIYITSTMGVGILCNYYYQKSWDKISKYDRYLFYVQGVFLSVLSFLIPIVLAMRGYFKRDLRVTYILLVSLPLILFGILTLNYLKNGRDILMRYLIFGSGIFMLFVSSTTNWYFDRTVIKKSVKTSYPLIKNLKSDPPKLEIYSSNFEIEDVWRVGKKIGSFEKNRDTLPEKFICFGEVPKEIGSQYEKIKEEIYLKDDGHLASLSYLKKREEV